MSSPAPLVPPVVSAEPSAPNPRRHNARHPHLPTVSEATASLLRTVVVALFLLTFVLQPFLIPSESMERTLLVGDFLMVNKQEFAPAGKPGGLAHMVLPYREVQRGDIIVFHHADPPLADPPLLIKRVVALPGDRVRVDNGRVSINGAVQDEPFVVFEPAAYNPFLDQFPAKTYTDPQVNSDWWRETESLTHDGALLVPPGMYFVLGDNRNHSKDSRYWGLVPRGAIVARPVAIYFSLRRPSATDVQQAADDKLEATQSAGSFARWKRIFQVVR